ncbi:hypothetical protein ES708_10439 [subsurface metagenome]
MDTPSYIKGLITPRNGQGAKDRRVWGVELARVWLPFMTACNTTGELAIPADALGSPLRLAYNADGSVKFSKAGRPVTRVAKPIAECVRMVRDNFTANLLDYASQVVEEQPDKYQRQLERAEKAGSPIIQRDSRELDKAVKMQTAEALRQAGQGEAVVSPPTPAKDKTPVTA